MGDELIDICDESNNLTGISKMKSEAHERGLLHRAVHIWIYNSRGEVLLQLRAKEKPVFPDVWDVSVAGHVGAGEDPVVSGIREMKEEIGLDVNENDLHFFKVMKTRETYKSIINNEFWYVYFMRFDGDIEGLRLQEEEVQKIVFLPIAKIEDDLKKNPGRYFPHGDYWNKMMDEVKRRLHP